MTPNVLAAELIDDENRMSARAKSRVQMFGAWSAIGYLVLVFGGWGVVAGFLPPTPPSATADQIAGLYQADLGRIRVGMVLVMLAALVFIPFAAVMTRFIARVEGAAGPLTYTFLLGAAGNMVLTFYPAIFWLTAAYRPDRSPDLIYLMNDLAWLQFLGGITMYLAMPITVLVTSLCDRGAQPLFPRWCGYANAWMALTIVPDQLLFFFHRGPFAWNGIFGVWIPAAVFAGFFVVNFAALRQTILRERRSA